MNWNWKFWKKTKQADNYGNYDCCNTRRDNEVDEEEDECTFVFTLKDGNVSIFVDWAENADISMVGALLGVISTGEIFPTVLNEVEREMSNRGIEDKLEELHAMIEHRMDVFGKQKDHERRAYRPAVEPLDAIQHQMTMYQQGRNGE